MTRLARFAFAVAFASSFAGAAACGGASAPEPAPSAPSGAAAKNGPAGSTYAGGEAQLASAPKHPTPYTAAQIRDATKPGRTYRYKVEAPDQPATEKVMTFETVDADGATLVSPGEPKKRVTWEELRQHAEFPEGLVKTRDEKITVPAGTFDCTVYVVVREGGEATSYYFAKTMPGAPVLIAKAKEGRRVMTSTLVEYRPGK